MKYALCIMVLQFTGGGGGEGDVSRHKNFYTFYIPFKRPQKMQKQDRKKWKGKKNREKYQSCPIKRQ